MNRDRERQKEKAEKEQGAARTRFPVFASVLLAGLACMSVLFFAAGGFKKKPVVFQSVSGESVKEQYRVWCASFGVVKIVCGDFWGSGVVIACEEDGLVIVSAKHLLMYDMQAEVSFYGTAKEKKETAKEGEETAKEEEGTAKEEEGTAKEGEGTAEGIDRTAVTGQVMGYSASYDLAYLYVSREALPPDVWVFYRERFEEGLSEGTRAQDTEVPGGVFEAELFWNEEGRRAAVRTDRAYRELRAGENITQIGMSESASLECYAGTAQAKEVFISDYNAFMFLNECRAKAGMSGGGVFDEERRLIGIIIAGDEQGTICMPMTTVIMEYRELGRTDYLNE